VNVPVYGTRFTLALARHRLEEAGIRADLREIAPGETMQISPAFRVEPVRVTHSVPDAVGLVVRTPTATLVHSGDFKLDGAPIDGQLTDLRRFGEVGEQGVDVLLSDSTNAEVPGSTPSERVVEETFGRILARAAGRRVFITLFGSHLHRVQHTVELARRHGRRVLLLGRSLIRNVELAQGAGILPPWHEVLVPGEAAASLPRGELLVLCTGAQAEPRSGLSNLLNPEPGPLRLERGDLVLLSSRTIPGNEPKVTDLMNRLLARGAEVIYPAIEPGIHVSGHASRDEQRRLLEVVKPRHFVPVHGELRHLHQHLQLASGLGLDARRLFLMTDGDVVGFTREGGTALGRVAAGRRPMRREGLAAFTDAVLADRRGLAESGLVVVVVALELGSGLVRSTPTVHGQALAPEEQAALPLAAEGARQALQELSEAMRGDDARVREALVRGTRRVFKQLLGVRPVVLPLVVRVP
jgi:ribonuclease J